MAPTRSRDPCSLANTLDFTTLSTALDYDLSFERKTLEGTVTHVLECVSDPKGDAVTGEVWLDSNHVDVKGVSIDSKSIAEGTGPGASWKKEEKIEPYGEKLVIKLGKKLAKGENVELKIQFRTTAAGTAIGWMEKEMTPNKKYPYMCLSSLPPHSRRSRRLMNCLGGGL